MIYRNNYHILRDKSIFSDMGRHSPKPTWSMERHKLNRKAISTLPGKIFEECMNTSIDVEIKSPNTLKAYDIILWATVFGGLSKAFP